MVNYIEQLGNWIQEKIQTKSGTLVLGMFLGVSCTGIPSYLVYLDNKTKEEVIRKKEEKIIRVEESVKEWQERAFNAENKWMDNLKEVTSFFQEFDSTMYSRKEEASRVVDKERVKLKEYQKLTKQLNVLKNELIE